MDFAAGICKGQIKGLVKAKYSLNPNNTGLQLVIVFFTNSSDMYHHQLLHFFAKTPQSPIRKPSIYYYRRLRKPASYWMADLDKTIQGPN